MTAQKYTAPYEVSLDDAILVAQKYNLKQNNSSGLETNFL